MPDRIARGLQAAPLTTSLLCLAATAWSCGGDPPEHVRSAEDPRQVWEDLEQRAPRLDGSTLRAAMRSFVERYADRRPPPPMLPLARLRLAEEALAARAPAEALEQFVHVRDTGPGTDLIARALYGIGQAHEMAGRPREAAAAYDDVMARHPASRYARFARAARASLGAAQRVRVGRPLPDPGKLTDATGRVHSLDEGAVPRLVAVVEAADPTGLDRVRAWLDAVTDRELRRFVVVVGPSARERALTDLAAATLPGDPVLIPVDGGYAAAPLSTWNVRTTPALLVVGPTGVLVARDPAPDRLAAMLHGDGDADRDR